MKQTHSRSLVVPVRISLAATCALILGATAAFAQSTGASSSTSSTPTNPDRYGSGSSSSSQNDKWQREHSGAQTNASTSGSGAASMNGRSSSDRASQSGSTYGSTSDTSSSSASTSTEKLPWRDRRFVTKAADHGQDELQLAQLAAEKATNPEVKNFAQKIIQDHEKVHSELQNLASQKNVKLDDDSGKGRTYKRLSNKSGEDFDREFVEHMVEMHEDDVKMFEKAASDAKDSDLRSFASKHVSDLRSHLQEAQNLQQSIVPTGRSSSKTHRSKTDTSTSGSSTSSKASDHGTTDATGAPKTGSGSDTSTSGSSSNEPKPRR